MDIVRIRKVLELLGVATTTSDLADGKLRYTIRPPTGTANRADIGEAQALLGVTDTESGQQKGS